MDIAKECVEGARRNLKYYKLQASVKQGDCRKLELIFHGRNLFDAVVTDLPYGRATRPLPEGFLEEFLDSVSKVLKPGCYAVISYNREIEAGRAFMLVELHRQRVHGSLTRHIHVFKKVKV